MQQIWEKCEDAKTENMVGTTSATMSICWNVSVKCWRSSGCYANMDIMHSVWNLSTISK